MTTTPNPTVPAVDTRPDVPELRRLLDAATEGRWRVMRSSTFGEPTAIEVDAGPYTWSVRTVEGVEPNPADPALIAALRNAAPWLLAQAAAVARVEALLAEYAERGDFKWGIMHLRAALDGSQVSG